MTQQDAGGALHFLVGKLRRVRRQLTGLNSPHPTGVLSRGVFSFVYNRMQLQRVNSCRWPYSRAGCGRYSGGTGYMCGAKPADAVLEH